MKKELMLEELILLLEGQNADAICKFLEFYHFADIAEAMDSLSDKESLALICALKEDDAAELLSYLEPHQQRRVADLFSKAQLASFVSCMFIDDAVDFLSALPEDFAQGIVQLTTNGLRKKLIRFMAYPEESAGSAMSGEFIELGEDLTVGEAIDAIRKEDPKLVSTHTCYITSADGKLLGVISISDLLTSPDDMPLSELAKTEVITAETDDTREKVASLIKKYDLLALPIVDSSGSMVGIVTVDDALDIEEEEATEDFEKMAAIHPTEESYLSTSTLSHTKSRLPWLMILMLSGLINGAILGFFEDAFIALPLLVTFIPMLTDTGGNAGSQSSTLVIRGLALGEINIGDDWKIIWKEIRISLLAGFILASTVFLKITFIDEDGIYVGLTVAVALISIVAIAKLCGGMLPVLAERSGIDPALMAAPLITTIVDAAGLIVFFLTARLLLNV